MIAAGIIPAGLEMMDQAAIQAVEPFVNAGYPTDAAGILLCESDGTHEEVARRDPRIEDIMTRSGAHIVRTSRATRPSACRFWAGRKAAFPAVGPAVARLLLHGRHHPAQAPRRSAARHRSDGKEIRPALRQRVPRRRRQPAPADPLRRQRSRPVAAHRGVRRRNPQALHRRRRHDHRRAWRRRRENRLDVRPVPDRGAGSLPCAEARVRRARSAQSGQGRADAAPLRRVRTHARAFRPARNSPSCPGSRHV